MSLPEPGDHHTPPPCPPRPRDKIKMIKVNGVHFPAMVEVDEGKGRVSWPTFDLFGTHFRPFILTSQNNQLHINGIPARYWGYLPWVPFWAIMGYTTVASKDGLGMKWSSPKRVIVSTGWGIYMTGWANLNGSIARLANRSRLA
ncbi:unnamed protein product [Peniophora sp. CBMAI 1063]|nr:unnamed protein product [Peniophora sp. CBMAI 1063]